MRSITLCHIKPGEVICWPQRGDWLEAHWAEIDGLNLKSYAPADYGACEGKTADRHLLIFRREIHGSHSFYNGGAYLDTLNREATDAFIQSTHAKYAKHCGEHFGSVIQGIFTDEPHRGFILCDAVEQPGAAEPALSLPYSESLFVEFSERFGEALQGRLPELYFQYQGQAISRLKWQYVELLQQLFLENWAIPCLQWCETHDLKLTGHVLHEDSLAAQVVPCGSLARYYEHMTYPGIDVLSKSCDAFWVAKQVVSVARQQGQPFVLSELYGGTGWDLDFTGHKRIGDWQAFQGINLRCHHLSWYSMAGEAKRDYPASIFHQSAWYQQYKYVEDYFSRIHFVLQQGAPDCDVLVLHPGESLWAQFHLGWATWLRSDSARIDAIEVKFQNLFRWLMDAQIDFDYGDEEQMGRLGSIEQIDGEGFLKLGQMRYRSVMVGGLETLRASTLKLLQDFVAAGGRVVFAGDPPAYVDALPSADAQHFAEAFGICPWTETAVVQAVRASSRQGLRVNAGVGAPGLISHVRRMADGSAFVALVNTREDAITSVDLEWASAGAVRIKRLDCRSGGIVSVDSEFNQDAQCWIVDFEALEEQVFHVEPVPEALLDGVDECVDAAPLAPPPQVAAELRLEGPFAYTLSEPNSLILDQARYRLADEAWSSPDDILRLNDQIRERMGWTALSGTMLQPWCQPEATSSGRELSLEFQFTIEDLPELIELMLEQPERWTFSLNGTDFAPGTISDWHIDRVFRRFPLPQNKLLIGQNVLTLRTDLREDTSIEAVYLLGIFGVSKRDAVYCLTALPSHLKAGDLVEQGFPFYTGAISYSTPLPAAVAESAFEVELFALSAACAEVSLGAHSQLIAFPPYRASFEPGGAADRLHFKVFLTRENLFGPLHAHPRDQSMTAPSSYRTKGEAYRVAHQCVPSGLLEAPAIRTFTP
ncbi:MAG: hypothetical protein EA353_14480 [Puniceicoccaceae bacterium]|nr:MAG: hypothetical protein EA353_14480 [Puniceicoccaceae bacterium]